MAQTKSKQIGFISALVISVGSTIGAGIFFKNSSVFANANGYLSFMIVSWIIAAFGVLAIAMSLLEMSSALKSNGITEYISKFTKKAFSKFSSSYMILIYLPINYFAMSFYAAMSLQDAIQSYNSSITLGGWVVFSIAFGFFAWFSIIGFFQKKLAIKSQWIYTIVKFIPLIIIPFFAIAQIDNDGITTILSSSHSKGFTGISPWLGLMASIPAILFAFDGFYTVTSLKSNLKNPNKMGLVVSLSLSIITTSYLIFGIITGLAGDGNSGEVKTITKTLKVIFNTFILFAVFGIINGFGLATPELYYQNYKNHPIGLIYTVKKIFKIKNDQLAAFISSIVIALIFWIILTPIGIYGITKTDYDSYGSNVGGLYVLADYLTNYTSLFVFVFIGGAIFGGIINRKTKKIFVEKNRWFIFSSIVSVAFLSIATLYMISANIIDMTGYNGANSQTEIVKFCIMIGTLLISLIPNIIDLIKTKREKSKLIRINLSQTKKV